MQADYQAALPGDQAELLSWLAAEVRARRLSQVEIAKASGVDQSQISRILAGQAKRSSTNVRKLCKYASAARRGIVRRTRGAAETQEALKHALLRAWDGSSEHGGALVDLLEAVDRVQRARRKAA